LNFEAIFGYSNFPDPAIYPNNFQIPGNTVAIQRLIEGGANKYAADRDNLNALHCAANHGYTEAVALLLKQCNRKLMEGKVSNLPI
jgi:ankyrin repeat protein